MFAPEIKKVELYHKNHVKQVKLKETVAEILVETLMSANALTHPLFDKAIKIGDSKLKWPHRRLLIRKLIPDMEKSVKEKIKKLLSKATSVAVNVDIWTSKRTHAYIAFSVSFVGEEFQLRGFEGTHTAHDIFEIAVEVIDEYNLKDLLHYMGTDNGGNVVNAFSDIFPGFIMREHDLDRNHTLEEFFEQATEDGMWSFLDSDTFDDIDPEDLDLTSDIANEVDTLLRKTYCRLQNRKVTVRCVAHTLQLCIKTAMKTSETLNSVIDCLSGIVSRVKHSPLQLSHLEKAFKGTLVSRNETRWNSVFLMCERAVKVDWNIAGLEPNNRLKTTHKEYLRSFVKLMTVFEEAFKLLQTAEYPVIGAVIPIIYGLKHHLRACKSNPDFTLLGDFIRKLNDEINSRFGVLETDELYLAATFLDPQYKLLWCRLTSEPAKTEERVRTLLLRMMNEVPVANDSAAAAEN
ncbi:uncharacterized protein LOC129602028 [Paramacrobiotus metropolitanus]|uniref:uncharacterized protein LOC129602028 n=1 Tax=Paramacrobiotus metropolitanus TaxID=2943436 RepID=UPI0024462089|nr:uncharacterized protein LOC129602028 [Paramacrobiotus metropolitanus]